MRTEPDDTESGAQSFYDNQSTALRISAEGIRYAAGHGARGDPPRLRQPGGAVSGPAVRGELRAVKEGGDRCAGFPDNRLAFFGVRIPAGIPPASSGSRRSCCRAATRHRTRSRGRATTPCSSPPRPTLCPSRTPFELQNFWSAACYVAATVALIKQRYPQLSPALVARALAMSARYHPHGGYSPSVGFGVLDPNDAILDAGTLARLTVSAPGGAPGTVAATAHFGGAPPGVISALPPVGRVAYLYWALIAVGAVLLGTGAALSARQALETVAGPARRLAVRSSRRTPGSRPRSSRIRGPRCQGATGTLEPGASGAPESGARPAPPSGPNAGRRPWTERRRRRGTRRRRRMLRKRRKAGWTRDERCHRDGGDAPSCSGS